MSRLFPRSVAAVVALATMTACGSDPGRPPESLAVATTTAVPTSTRVPVTSSTTVAPPVVTWGVLRTYELRIQADDGYSRLVTVTIGAPVAARDYVESGTDLSCDVDLEKDLIVPLGVTVTNSTPEFSQRVSHSIFLAHGERLYNQFRFGSGRRCNSNFRTLTTRSSRIHIESADELLPQAATRLDGFVGMTDFFGPAGEAVADLAQVFLAIGAVGGGTTISGQPHWIGQVAAGTQYLVPLDGQSDPCAPGNPVPLRVTCGG